MKNVLELLENICLQYPQKDALVDQRRSVSFEKYLADAKAIGTAIFSRIGGANKPVAVFCDSSVESIIAFMGAVYSGNFYVPVDDTLPAKRLNEIVRFLRPGLIVLIKPLQMEFESDIGAETVPYSELANTPVRQELLKDIRTGQSFSDPVFGIFTSGSTGIPKIVIKNHYSVLDLVRQFSKTFSFSEESVFANQSPFYFDVSAKDIYLSMAHGGRLEIIPRTHFSFPMKLVEYLNERKVNTLIWSTFALRLLANFKVFDSAVLQYVRLVMFSGEPMPNKVLNYWRRHVEARYVNLYGTSETTFNCLFYPVDKEFDETEALPIGKVFENSRVLLLDEAGREVQGNEPGEICVLGSTLAIGYYGDLELTNRMFCQNPLNSLYPERMYRTGDLGYRTEDGNIVFLSRKDHQVKHMGHRIELDEIETAVNSMEEIDICCCLYDRPNEKILLLYQAAEPVDARIYEYLKRRLPKYMLPNRLIYIGQLPLNQNRKVDRAYLKEKYLNANR